MIKNVFARYLVLLTVGGSLLGGTAVGLATPGWQNHHGVWHVHALHNS